MEHPMKPKNIWPSGQELTSDKIMTRKQWALLRKEINLCKEGALASGKQLSILDDYYLIKIGWNTGLRISEIADLEWRDIGEDWLIVREGKGKKKRTVFIGKKTIQLFAEYREFKELYAKPGRKKLDKKDPIFWSNRGKITRFGVHRRFKKWIAKCSLPDSLSYKSLRHGYATRMLEDGVPLSTLSKQMGHSSIAVTGIYLHFTSEGKDKIQELT